VILHWPRVIASVNYYIIFYIQGKKMNENCSSAAQKQQHSAQGVAVIMFGLARSRRAAKHRAQAVEDARIMMDGIVVEF
jgi:hypothetical protein